MPATPLWDVQGVDRETGAARKQVVRAETEDSAVEQVDFMVSGATQRSHHTASRKKPAESFQSIVPLVLAGIFGLAGIFMVLSGFAALGAEPRSELGYAIHQCAGFLQIACGLLCWVIAAMLHIAQCIDAAKKTKTS